MDQNADNVVDNCGGGDGGGSVAKRGRGHIVKRGRGRPKSVVSNTKVDDDNLAVASAKETVVNSVVDLDQNADIVIDNSGGGDSGGSVAKRGRGRIVKRGRGRPKSVASNANVDDDNLAVVSANERVVNSVVDHSKGEKSRRGRRKVLLSFM